MNGQSTDSGGAGIGVSLMKELRKLFILDPRHFELTFCSLRGVQLSFANPIKVVYGEGKIGKRNAMQMLFVAYALQETMDKAERPFRWQITTGGEDGSVPLSMATPVLSRWWWVNQALDHMLEKWDGWYKVAESTKNASNSGSLPHRLASILISLMGEPKLQMNLMFISGYSRAFFIGHFKWLQSHDAVAKKNGFLSRHMAMRTYLMKRDLDCLSNDGWMKNKHFVKFTIANGATKLASSNSK